MKYGYTIVYVESVEATLQFYVNAFGFVQKFITPEKDYGELVSGDTTLAFASIELGNSNFKKGYEVIRHGAKPLGIELAFVSEDIKRDFEKAIQAGATEYEKIVTKPWGQKVGYLRDNNGFLIEICTPVNNNN